MSRVDLGEDKIEETAVDPPAFVAERQPAADTFATDGGFKGRAPYLDRSALVQTKRHQFKPRDY